MDRNASALLAPLHPEVASVLAVLTEVGSEERVRHNDISGRSGLPTGHVGRHLRTLERDRLVRSGSGAWQATLRGMRYATVRADQQAPAAGTPLDAPAT
jgi:DNA-binding IclR family transcriptional regulator